MYLVIINPIIIIKISKITAEIPNLSYHILRLEFLEPNNSVFLAM